MNRIRSPYGFQCAKVVIDNINNICMLYNFWCASFDKCIPRQAFINLLFCLSGSSICVIQSLRWIVNEGSSIFFFLHNTRDCNVGFLFLYHSLVSNINDCIHKHGFLVLLIWPYILVFTLVTVFSESLCVTFSASFQSYFSV